jgi:hypothetical protein
VVQQRLVGCGAKRCACSRARDTPVEGGGAEHAREQGREPAGDASSFAPDFRLAPGSSTATAALPPSPPPADCQAIRQCVTTKFPRVFGAESFAARKRELQACFGSSKAQWHQAAECGPIEFSRDLAKGLAVEAYATCSDVCPSGATVQARYAGVSKAECVCIGGTRHEMWPRSFAGCWPYPAAVVTRRDATGKPKTEPTTEVPLELLGFTLFDTVKEVDGRRMRPQTPVA